MDGGRRLLQSVKEVGASFAAPSFALAGTAGFFDVREERAAARPAPRSGRRRAGSPRNSSLFRTLCIELALTAAFFAGVGFYGAVKGGEYETFVAANGRLPDILAKTFGFGIKAVTIIGERELGEQELLDAAGIGPRNSLVFLDVEHIRERLKAIPLVKEVSVSKLYPDRLVLEIEERQPFALWQQNGDVRIVAADGMPIDSYHNSRFANLPFVVGEGANERLGEYVSILDALGDLRTRIRAGMLVSERRWTLKDMNGVEVELPEKNPAAAVATLIQLQRDFHVLDKDVVSLDLRQPGRVVARLTAEAASARADMLARKAKPKGGQT